MTRDVFADAHEKEHAISQRTMEDAWGEEVVPEGHDGVAFISAA